MQLAEIKTVTMTSLEIAELVGSRHDDVKRSIERLANRLVIVQPPMADEQERDKLGRPRTTQVYVFSGDKGKRDSFVVVAQLSPEFTGALVDRWQELEAQAKPRLPSNYIEALQALLQSEQEKERLQLERDAAIETKAEIGSRREATAMATASNATQRANKLEIELDQSKQYATIKRMSLLYHGLKFNWRELREASNEMGLPPIDVYDANYGTVKGYHADAWLAIYSLEII